MDSAGLIVLHSSIQYFAALGVGSVIDAKFPAPRNKESLDDTEALMTACESLGQVMLCGFLAAAFISRVRRLNPARQDVTHFLALGLMLELAQPNLRTKVEQLGRWVQQRLRLVVADKPLLHQQEAAPQVAAALSHAARIQ